MAKVHRAQLTASEHRGDGVTGFVVSTPRGCVGAHGGNKFGVGLGHQAHVLRVCLDVRRGVVHMPCPGLLAAFAMSSVFRS